MYALLALPLLLVGSWAFPFVGFILFLWMGAAVLPAFWRGRTFCHLCPRGIFFDAVLPRFSRRVRIPVLFRGTAFRLIMLGTLIAVMGSLLWRTWGVLDRMGAGLGSLLLGTTLFGIVLAVLFAPRAWCSICPMGTMAAWIGRGKYPLQVDATRCTQCGACARACPLQLRPGSFAEGGQMVAGDCIKCGTCVKTCRQQALAFPGSTPPASQPIYLNHAATSWPKAPGVAHAMTEVLQAMPAVMGRTHGVSDPTRCPLGPLVQECRERLATLLDVDDMHHNALTAGATAALNQAIWGIGLTLPPGAHIITSVAEHNAVLRPLRHLQRHRQVRVTYLGFDATGALDAGAFSRLVADDPPALVVFTHASNVTGRVYAIGPLFERAKAVGAITVLDASQAIGHRPVHPRALQADLVAFPAHKGLLGPAGVGVLYMAPGIDMEPLLVGGTGEDSDAVFHPMAMPARLEAGTPNSPGIAGFTAALRWQEQDSEAYRHRERELAASLRAGLRAIPGVRLYDDLPDGEYVPVVSFTFDGLSVEEAGHQLAARGIVCRTGLHCAPLMHNALGTAPEGTIRFSVSGCMTHEEIKQALGVVTDLAIRPAIRSQEVER